MIIGIRSEAPEACIVLHDGQTVIARHTWHAHRRLAETIHQTVQELLVAQNITEHDITGVVVYHGPGSFTGLRIGISVANALAYALGVAVVGVEGDDWVEQGVLLLQTTEPGPFVAPKYGAPVHITQPKK